MRKFILLMNVINRFSIKDCLALFYILDITDMEVVLRFCSVSCSPSSTALTSFPMKPSWADLSF